MNFWRFHELFESKFVEFLPEAFQDCFLEASRDGVLGREVKGPEIEEEIFQKIRPWQDRIADLPEYTNSDVQQFRYYEWEGVSAKNLKSVWGVEIPYPHGVFTVSHTAKGEKKAKVWKLKWRLLRKHHRYGPRRGFILCGGGGASGPSHNMGKGIAKKTEKYRKRCKDARQYARFPFVLFLDGRPLPTPGFDYDFSDLQMLFTHSYRWKGRDPDAIVVVGTWGVPRGVEPSKRKELEETTADMVFNPLRLKLQRNRYPRCLNPFLRKWPIRQWSIGEYLLPVD